MLVYPTLVEEYFLVHDDCQHLELEELDFFNISDDICLFGLDSLDDFCELFAFYDLINIHQMKVNIDGWWGIVV